MLRFRHGLFEVLVDFVEEAHGRQPRLVGPHQQCQVFGHVARFDGVDADRLQCLGEPG